MHASPTPLTDVRPGFEIDLGHLREYLAALGLVAGEPLAVRQFAGGQSNPTYLVASGAARYVLRRKPPGPLLPSAHAIEREFRVLQALSGLAGVAVPRAIALCEEPSVIGTAFYLMEYVPGRVFRDAAFPEVPRAGRFDYAMAVIAALAALHRVDPAAAGLADFGRPGGYVARQFRRWSRQYLDDRDAGRVPDMDRMIEWLPAHLPEDDRTCVVHGDYRCDNVLFHPESPRVVAVLDWELATLGDPLADLGYHVMMYRMPALGVTGLAGLDLEALGLPDEETYVARYCRLTGRDSIPRLDVYVAFNLFKLAAVFHGIRGRLLRGTAADPRAREYAGHVEALAALAWEAAARAGRSGD